MLHESLEFFEACLKIQEGQYAQHLTPPLGDSQDCQMSESIAPIETTSEEIWASVVEPVTVGTLQETCLAQIEALTTLCSIQSKDFPEEISSIEQIYRNELSVKVNLYAQSPESRTDAILANAKFLCVYAGARYRLLYTSVLEFDSEFQLAILDAESMPRKSNDAGILLMIADAHVEFNTSIEDRLQQNQEIPSGKTNLREINRICWKHISYALELYTLATKVPNVLDLARIHIKRGDCELLRIRLGEEPFMYEPAEKSQATLIKNALVYYSAAKKVMSGGVASLSTKEESDELELKIALTTYWHGLTYVDIAKFATYLRESDIGALPRLEEMKDQGLLSETSWEGIQDAFAKV